MEIKNVQATNLTTDYLKFCVSRKNLDQKTIKSYTIDLRQYFEFTMESAIEWTNKKSIEQYIDLLHFKYKPKSVKRKIASLKAFFALLRFQGPSAAAAAAPRRGAGAPSPSAPVGRIHLSQRERQEALPVCPWYPFEKEARNVPSTVLALPLTDSPGRGRWHEVPEGE